MRLLAAVLSAPCLLAQTYTISTIAGVAPPVNIQAVAAGLDPVLGVVLDIQGNAYISVQYEVLRVGASTGTLTLVAGNGTAGFSGDGESAVNAQLGRPTGLALDASGNLYIADSVNNRVRVVNTNGSIATVAGNGTAGYSGDNIAATSAALNQPQGVAVDSFGNLYIADTGNNRIRKVTNGVITTVAGDGIEGYGGDSVAATATGLNQPQGVAFDSAGNLYIADTGDNRIREVSSGVITTVAGNGIAGFSMDYVPATTSELNRPQGVAFDSTGNLYIADTGNNRVRFVSSGFILPLAGTGSEGFSGDGGQATGAQLSRPGAVAVYQGVVYIADSYNNRVRNVSNSAIFTTAGSGMLGDGGPAAAAQLLPSGVAVDAAGDVFIADTPNSRIREVSGGSISTFAGTGVPSYLGDNGPPGVAELNAPQGVAVDAAGNLYIADTANSVIRKISKGLITTVAGDGTAGYGGDGEAATSATLSHPTAVVADAAGDVFIADTGNNLVREIQNGVITTIAGTRVPGFYGDGGPGTSAALNGPNGMAIDSAGNLYIADQNNARIRKISGGTITTFAGNGTPGFRGDGGPAINAQLNQPWGVAVDAAGNVYVGDNGNNRIRKIVNGVILSIAGDSGAGFSGDNGPGTAAELDGPQHIAVDSSGKVYIADTGNARVRLLTPGPTPRAATITLTVSPAIQTTGAPVTFTATVAPSSATGMATFEDGTTPLGSAALSGGAATMQISTLAAGAHTITAFYSGDSGDAPASSTALSVTILKPGQTDVLSGGIVSAASYTAPVAPGSLVAIFTSAIAAQAASVTSSSLPSSLSGVSITINGYPAPIVTVAPAGPYPYITAQVPFEILAAGQNSAAATAVVTVNQVASDPATVSIVPAAPGIFTLPPTGQGNAALVNLADSSIAAPAGSIPGFATHPIPRGQTAYFYATGLGALNPQVPDGSGNCPASNGLCNANALPVVLVGGVAAQVSFAGQAPGYPGVDQINITIPMNAPTGSAVTLTVASADGSVVSNAATIAVQ